MGLVRNLLCVVLVLALSLVPFGAGTAATPPPYKNQIFLGAACFAGGICLRTSADKVLTDEECFMAEQIFEIEIRELSKTYGDMVAGFSGCFLAVGFHPSIRKA